MANMTVIEFIQKWHVIEEREDGLEETMSMEEIISLAEANGYHFTEEQYMETIGLLRKAKAIKAKSENGETLTDDELEIVIGGAHTPRKMMGWELDIGAHPLG